MKILTSLWFFSILIILYLRISFPGYFHFDGHSGDSSLVVCQTQPRRLESPHRDTPTYFCRLLRRVRSTTTTDLTSYFFDQNNDDPFAVWSKSTTTSPSVVITPLLSAPLTSVLVPRLLFLVRKKGRNTRRRYGEDYLWTSRRPSGMYSGSGSGTPSHVFLLTPHFSVVQGPYKLRGRWVVGICRRTCVRDLVELWRYRGRFFYVDEKCVGSIRLEDKFLLLWVSEFWVTQIETHQTLDPELSGVSSSVGATPFFRNYHKRSTRETRTLGKYVLRLQKEPLIERRKIT